MHLKRLKIFAYRNLRDFEIHFTRSAPNEDGSGPAHVFKSHAVIGQNGTGKSNLIEALVTIFRDLDLHEPAGLDYELDYHIRGANINLRATVGEYPIAHIDGEEHNAWFLSDVHRPNPVTGQTERGHARRYLPSHIFTYYSGKSERLESIFQQHQQRYIDNLDDTDELGERQDSDSLLRRLFYCRHPHSRFVLLACLLAPEMPLRDVLRNLEIEDVDSALFVLKKPYRLGDEFSTEEIAAGDRRFWFDRTRFSQEFLDPLWAQATAPIAFTEDKVVDFRGRTEQQELLYLFLKDRVALDRVRDALGDSYRFFQYLEGSFVADLIDDLKIFVRRRNGGGLVSCEALSEGELQLLTVLGLMRLTVEDHCLFLLDEPDTHLNPVWKLRYFEEIEQALKHNESRTLLGDSQIIVTTHDPMMLGGLRKDQVRILKNESGRTVVRTPNRDPQGMDVSGLLKSDLFGLASTLDQHTLDQLRRRNELLARQNEPDWTPAEQTELEWLRDRLSNLGFALEYRDPLYQEFIEKMYKVRSQPLDQLLPPSELRAQEELAEKIVRELAVREKVNDLSELARELSIEINK